MNAFHVSEQMTATGSGQELRGNYRQEAVLGHTNLERGQLLVLCERLGLDILATPETLKERIEGWANCVVPTLLTPSQAPIESGERPILRPTCPAGHGQMTLRQNFDGSRLFFACPQWKTHHCRVTFTEHDWFELEFTARCMANRPPRDLEEYYRMMEARSVNVDDLIQSLRTDGANGGSSVASSPPPERPASEERAPFSMQTLRTDGAHSGSRVASSPPIVER